MRDHPGCTLSVYSASVVRAIGYHAWVEALLMARFAC